MGRERRDLADDASEIEAQLGVELAGKLLHALVIGKARHMQELDAAVAGGEQRSLEQGRADAVALPRPLDRECRFRFARKRRSDLPQLGGAAQGAVYEEPVNDGIDSERQPGISAHEFVGHGAGKAAAPAVGV